MQWKKLGCIFAPHKLSDYIQEYARIPIVDHLYGDMFALYFGARDCTNRERIFRAYLNMSTYTITDIDRDPILDFGETLGAFDDNGINPCCIVNVNGRKLLYYCGWNIHVKIPFTCAVGLAESFDGGKTFVKLFKGAVLDRDRIDYQFVAVNDVIYDNNIFKTWYLSCIEWKIENGKPKHYYNIHYAESLDGINWNKLDGPVIDFKNEYEYAISTPRVIKDEPNHYKMWYSYRGQKHIDTYRIGYAESEDGIHWIRKDEAMSSFDVSETGWDSEMICYPYLFKHNDRLYMLYNGNNYGKTGCGLAVLEQN
ncbi:MAG: hypothetical protein IJU79_05685 [Desulfovibrionaceae bacterium]|nr:hypothetical protein [Desulfovibrionaceae bacterium]